MDEPSEFAAAAEEAVISFEATPADHGERADKVVLARLPDWSRQRVQKLFECGRVWREDAALVKKQRIREGDQINIDLPPPAPAKLRPVALPLDILIEDAAVIALNKAAGMIVHPGNNTAEDTLAHALLAHCGPSIAEVGSPERPGIVHRLDKETTGVIIAAKTAVAYRQLVQSFSERRPQKTYLALVCPAPAQESGRIEAPIGRHPVHRHRMAVRPEGRPAESHWRVRERFGNAAALVEMGILTGRTHQIRVHMAHFGHPLAGDATYGFHAADCPVACPRVMLHAAALTLPHPTTGETLALRAPLPADMVACLSEFRERFSGESKT